MDLQQLNNIASRGYPPTKKISELAKDSPLIITKMRQVKTKFGNKIIVESEDKFQMFLPLRVSEAIIKDDNFLNRLHDSINKMKLFIIIKQNNTVEFSTA